MTTLQTVREWLRDLYSGQDPEWEETPETLAALEKLMNRSKEAEKDAKIVIDDLALRKEEYEKETQRLKTLLASIGIRWDDFTPRGQTIARVVAELALVIEAKDVQLSSLYAVLSDVITENRRMEELCCAENERYDALMSKTRAGLERLGRLKRLLTSLESNADETESSMAEQRRGTALLGTKSDEYRRHVADLRASLKAAGMDSSLQHHVLVKMANELSELKNSLTEPLRKLESYLDLPPNVELARVKVEETRQELAVIEEALQRSVNAITLQ